MLTAHEPSSTLPLAKKGRLQFLFCESEVPMLKHLSGMKIVVIGGTGLIGTKLVNKLRQSGHEVEGMASDARRGQTGS